MQRLLIVPRLGANSRSDWYPWLGRQLSLMALWREARVTTLDMPNPSQPSRSAWTERILRELGGPPEELSRTILVGHSVGVQAILSSLARLERPGTVAAVIGVAAWWELDHPSLALGDWLKNGDDYVEAKPRSRGFTILLSDNDPQTADWRKNRRLWQTRLDARVILSPGSGHFTGEREPSLLDVLAGVGDRQRR